MLGREGAPSRYGICEAAEAVLWNWFHVRITDDGHVMSLLSGHVSQPDKARVASRMGGLVVGLRFHSCRVASRS